MKIHVTDRDGNEHTVEGQAGDNLMLPLHAADLVEATCSGSCSCATCHVFVDAACLDKLAPAEAAEIDMLDFIMLAQSDSRLACQVQLTEDTPDLKVTIAPEEGF
jgi:2Fe-2S ferredoxin